MDRQEIQCNIYIYTHTHFGLNWKYLARNRSDAIVVNHFVSVMKKEEEEERTNESNERLRAENDSWKCGVKEKKEDCVGC